MNIKKCSKCKVEKQVTEFFKNKCKKDSYDGYCKDCTKLVRKKTDSKLNKERAIKSRYGLTKIQLDLKFEKQNSSCGICKNKLDLNKRSTYIDHNHKTGETRDILCSKCNTVLGFVNEDIELLKEFIEYIKKYNIN